MSDTVSTASKTIGTHLSQDCSSSNIKFLFTICGILLLISIITSIVSGVMSEAIIESQLYRNRELFNNNQENTKVTKASNEDNGYSKIVPLPYKRIYQSIPLTPPESDSSTFITAQANKYILQKDNNTIYRLEVLANLFELDGNVYGDLSPQNHSYRVYISNDTDKLLLGTLEKNGDNVYKLKVELDFTKELMDKNNLYIIYQKDNNEEIILQGTFNK